ncbi:putative ATPase [Rivularia sp. PCC 7116]|uniref:AAA family ATPase n=1 Tax=Rivularia sp. PCC 7116 TaxID=373994 RepID=UPI00029F0BA7|nr:AAA family ATPase [Rivularia sp. PCC 7116]AFY56347.1 putative ATPase [Rivularia sp. PCC 7116]
MVDKQVSIVGYSIKEELYNGSRTIVYRAIQDTDQKPVVIKLLKNPYPDFNELLQFRNQYAIAKSLDISGIVRPYNLQPYQNSYALIMEDFGGISLYEYMKIENATSEEDILAIALQITVILHNLHQNRVIHKDIKPDNILINPETCEVRLIDFSIASLLPKETQSIKNPNSLEGTLAYLSPEQTGRMNRGIDYRSDFYSFGVTLYQLLTGELPFKSDDAMELLHCHIAKTPPAIKKVHPNPLLTKQREQEIPEVLSDIVMKLMAKNAEDRYQTALGLKYDLEVCLKQLQETGNIKSFKIAQRDICDRFIIPEKLYGREAEVRELLAAFDRVTNNQTELMLVAGFSGIGKTAVVNEIHKPIVKQRGYFLKGKFDQFNRNIPFSAFVQALRNLMEQLLSETDAQLSTWQDKILQALGDNAQVIIEVIPELEIIIGKQPAVAELSRTAAQNRFNLLFQKFIQVFTTKEHPLVIFLDDLQWADSASLNLMQLLMVGNQKGYLFLIGAYRDSEVFPAHPLMLTFKEISQASAIINTITLAPLNEANLNQLVSDTLNCNLEISQPLTQLVYQKTKGNPFFSTQFLKSLYEDDLIQFDFDSGSWQCNISQIRTLALTSDVVEFMALQLQKLPEETQNILKLAACIGNQFDLATLAIVSEQSEAETAKNLWKALQENLILPQSEVYKFYLESEIHSQRELQDYQIENYNSNYKFLHDRVQQAAYSLIPEKQKQTTHYHIGQLLFNNTPEYKLSENIFEIVNQLNIGIDLITNVVEQNQLAKLNLIAGCKAKTATAYSAAMNYLTLGRNLLATTSWQNCYELTLSLYQESTEAAYLNTKFEEMNQLINEIHNRAKTLLDRIKVYEIEIQAHMAQNQFSEAIETGLQVLKLLGINFPETPNQSHIEAGMKKTFANLAQRNPLELIDIPVMSDDSKLAALRILNCVFPCAYQVAPQLLPLLVMEQVNLSIKYGNSAISATGYGMWALILCGIVGDIETGYQFGELALSLLERFNSKEIQAGTIFVVNADVKHYREHVRETLASLQSAYSIGLETGDLKFAALATNIYIYHSYLSGNNLLEINKNIDSYNQFLHKFQQINNIYVSQQLQQAIINLSTQVENPCQLTGEVYNQQEMLPLHQQANDATVIFYIYFNQLILNYLFGSFEQALENTTEAEKYLVGVTGNLVVPVFYFYDSLIKLATHKVIDVNSKAILNKIENNQNKMKHWAQNAPMNYQHKFDLVEAEKYRILDDKIKALEFYDKAIFGAKINEYLQEEGLANELAAKFYLDWGKEKVAAGYMQEAYYCFARWGAKAKTDDLEKCYPQLLLPILQTEKQSLHFNETQVQTLQTIQTNRSSSSICDTLDFASLLKSTQALSTEIQLEDLISTLLQILIENAGAEKAALVLFKDNILSLEAIATKELGVTHLSIPYETSVDIPKTIINYVKNSLKYVVLNNATIKNNFLADEYFIQEKPYSLLCIPILNQAKLIGLLYLENKLTIGAFTREKLEVINLLCSQAAISLVNARLYQKSQIYGKKLEQSLCNLQQVQQKLIEDEKNMQIQVSTMCELSQSQAINLGDLTTAFQELTEKTAFTLQIERVSIWLFDDEGTKIKCVDLFEKKPHSHSQGLELFAVEYPNYFAAISSQPIVAADDAQNDINTYEFKENYLSPLNILSMLDSSLQIDGEVGGVICCEQVGSQRIWTKAEQNFIRSVANLITLAIESNRRHQKTEKLEQTLSELKQAQLQMVQNEKMASLGNLVAGVAHEVNNPIGFLTGSISNAEDYIQDLFAHIKCYQENYPNPEEEVNEHAEDIDLEYLSEDLPKLLNSMRLATERVKDISTSLRTFSRADTSQKVACNIHEGIDSTILILKYRLKANDKRPEIGVIKKYGKLPPVKCFLGQLNQVFMNIIANAIDALDTASQGKAFAEIKANPHKITINTEFISEENTVIISIKDNGSGMPESVRERIFDNLFTTKGVGKGTGLGLAIAKQIVEETHNGKLSCNSTLGEGTEFVIELPISEQ